MAFSFPGGTEMFHFPPFAPPALQREISYLTAGWVTPFGNPRIETCLAAPRGFSQPATSFVAF